MRHKVINIIGGQEIVILGISKEVFNTIAPLYKEVIKGTRDRKEKFNLSGYVIEYGKLFQLGLADKVSHEFLEKVLIKPNRHDYFCYACHSTRAADRRNVPDGVQGAHYAQNIGAIHDSQSAQWNCLLATISKPEYVAIFACKAGTYNLELDEEYQAEPTEWEYKSQIAESDEDSYAELHTAGLIVEQ